MKDLIIVRGGGDIATGTIYKLVKSGFHVLILEITHPSAIRRNDARRLHFQKQFMKKSGRLRI